MEVGTEGSEREGQKWSKVLGAAGIQGRLSCCSLERHLLDQVLAPGSGVCFSLTLKSQFRDAHCWKARQISSCFHLWNDI